MAGPSLSDAQLLELFHDKRADLSLLTPDEQTRLVSLTDTAKSTPAPAAPERNRLGMNTAPAKAAGLDPNFNMGETARTPSGFWQEAKAHPAQTLAMLGATLATGGLGPGTSAAARIVGAFLGGAGGAGAGLTANAALGGEAPSPTTARGVATEMGKEGAVQAAAQATGEAIPRIARVVARVPVAATLRPAKYLREDFGGAKGIADTILNEGVYSEGSAERALNQSRAQADQVLADAQAAGTPGVSRVAVARSVLGQPKATAKLRMRLGVPDATPDLTEQAKAIFRNNPSSIPLTESQAMKREAQDLAYERGADNNTIGKLAEKAKAAELRAGMEQRVPEVGPLNERSQGLLGAYRSFAEAADRPRSLTNTLAALSAPAGFLGAGKEGAALMPLLIKGMDSPTAGALTGLAIDRFGQGMTAQTMRAALLAKLLQETPQEP